MCFPLPVAGVSPLGAQDFLSLLSVLDYGHVPTEDGMRQLA
jgi:hypothetical protein